MAKTKKKNKLVIVESPAKAKTISKFLGKGYDVEASMGHVIDLPKSQLGVDVENDFEPKYITIRGKGKTLQKLKRKAKKSKGVLLATDPDREGEAISWHLAHALKIDEDSQCRIEFNEITKTAIQKALNDVRAINKERVNAQQARRILDRLVGYKLSPLLWQKVRKGLSAGRVQSVAVKIICDQEEKIEAFDPEEYWTIETQLKSKSEEFKASLHRINNKKFKISNQAKADKITSELKEENLEVIKVKDSKRRRYPSAPFTTSTLQQQAATKINFSAKKTMYVAQQLYEGLEVGADGTTGLITYMRTDSTRISSEAKDSLRRYIKEEIGQKYLSKKPKNYQAKSGAQDAHEAIRPTSVLRTPEKIKGYLNKEQYKLYKLIWERFVASQMSPAVYKTLRVDIQAGKYLLRAKGSVQLFAGFLKIDSSKQSSKDEILPDLEEGEKLDLNKMIPEQHFTKPPARYTEAKLVKTLENKGIGRPSTYATIVGTIQNRGYVEKEDNKFKPTELGGIVNGLLSEHFPKVTNIEFTAQLEDDLDRVESGNVDWVQLLKGLYFPFKERLEEAFENMESVNIEEETDEICEKCGRNMVVKYGRYGKFLACPGYPDCKNTKPFLNKIGIDCPECDDGEVVKRKSKKGRSFYGCSNYPKCEFMSWAKPVNKECPECGNSYLLEKNNRSGKKIYCPESECNYQQEEE